MAANFTTKEYTWALFYLISLFYFILLFFNVLSYEVLQKQTLCLNNQTCIYFAKQWRNFHMKSTESCQRRSYVAQAELGNHKTFLKYQPDSSPHPKLIFSFVYESARATFKTKTGKRTGGRGQNGKEMGKDWFSMRYRKDNKIRDSKQMIVLQKEVRMWQIALSRSKKPQGFFQSSVSNIGVAEPQSNLTAHIFQWVSFCKQVTLLLWNEGFAKSVQLLNLK